MARPFSARRRAAPLPEIAGECFLSRQFAPIQVERLDDPADLLGIEILLRGRVVKLRPAPAAPDRHRRQTVASVARMLLEITAAIGKPAAKGFGYQRATPL